MITEETINRLMKLTPVYIVERDFNIKKVIFNNPATIVIWGDGTKTVVKCSEKDVFDEEKGIALCYMKRVLGNKGSYNEVFKKWIKPQDETDPQDITDILDGVREFVESAARTIAQSYKFNSSLEGDKDGTTESKECNTFD